MNGKIDKKELILQLEELKRENEAYREKQSLYLTAYNSITEVIVKMENPEELLENVNRIMGETLGLDRTLIYHISGEKNQVTAMCEWLNEGVTNLTSTKGVYPLELFKDSYVYLIGTQKYIESHTSSINRYFLSEGSGSILHNQMNIKSLLWYPFDFDGKEFYLFALNQVIREREWRADEIVFINSVAKQVSLVLMKKKLYEERKVIERNEETLKKLNVDKDRLLSILAHDLRNPFNSLMGFSSLLLENIDTYEKEEIEEYIKIIDNKAKQTFELLDQLLLWVRSQSGKLNLEKEKFTLKESVTEILSLVENQSKEKGIRVNIVKGKDLLIEADLNMFKTVVRNLIANAIKFTNRGGEIKISAELRDKFIIITVLDNGVGIEQEIIDRIWNIYDNYTSQGTNNETGTGFGLSLCKELVEKQGGEIWVESEPGKGSAFKFSLPRI